jgi:hypothetical protein
MTCSHGGCFLFSSWPLSRFLRPGKPRQIVVSHKYISFFICGATEVLRPEAGRTVLVLNDLLALFPILELGGVLRLKVRVLHSLTG